MGTEKLVVVGGDAAGMSAASKAKRENPNLDVTVFEKKDIVSFGLCGLPYYVSGLVEDLDDLIAMTPETFREKRDIDVRTEHEVLSLHPESKEIVVRNGENGEITVDYDKLLIATGARATKPPIYSESVDNLFTLRWLKDGEKVRRYIENRAPQNAVLTSGYIGLEMAEAFRELGLEVTLLAKHENLLPMVDGEIADVIEEELSENEVELRTNSKVEGFKYREDNEIGKVVTGGEEIETDLMLLSVGAEPAVNLAKDAGIRLGPTGAIAVDERMKTNYRDIYAAGDCVESTHIVSGEKIFLPLGDVANRQGRVAGTNIGGGDAGFPGVLGTAITKIFDLGVARTGITERKAEELGFDFVSSTITQGSRAFYYPGGSKVTIKVIVEEESGRLLGAQLAGKGQVSTRINAFASLVNSETPVQEIQYLDLAYAPPYSPAWDPIQTAAKVAASKM
ncbi:MAG: FAD-dependent oxidoreductase [Candidatus Bipolaricaulota bacterium]